MNVPQEEVLIQAINEQTKAQKEQTKAIMALVESNQSLIVLLASSLAENEEVEETSHIPVYLSGKPKEQHIDQVRTAAQQASEAGFRQVQGALNERR